MHITLMLCVTLHTIAVLGQFQQLAVRIANALRLCSCVCSHNAFALSYAAWGSDPRHTTVLRPAVAAPVTAHNLRNCALRLQFLSAVMLQRGIANAGRVVLGCVSADVHVNAKCHPWRMIR